MPRLPTASSPIWVAAGAAASGIATYGLLVVTGRALGPHRYGDFSFLWAVVVVVSMGVFLPIEQAVARRASRGGEHPGGYATTLAGGIRSATGPAAVAGGVVAVLWIIVRGWSSTELVYLAIVLAVLASSVLQFPARGVLAARSDYRAYGSVVVVDSGVRLLVALALWAVGIQQATAYAAAVGLSALACGLVAVILATGGAPLPRPRAAAGIGAARCGGGSSELRRLVVAATCMQLLLNSGVLVATVAPGRETQLAGHLVAVLTLSRLPVFVAQSLQASYLSRAARHAHRGEVRALRRLLGGLAVAVAAVGGATVAAAATIGPALIAIVYGKEYAVGRSMTVLVALGAALFLAAVVANDVAVALGAHRFVQAAWLCAAAAAVVTATIVPGLLLRSALPLVVGAAAAGALLVPHILRLEHLHYPRRA